MDFLRLLAAGRCGVLDAVFSGLTYFGSEIAFMAAALLIFWCVDKRQGYYVFLVGALGTVYALASSGDGVADALKPLIAVQWSLATALSLLAWFVFAPQCLSTLAAVKRETHSWRHVWIMAAYLFGLAYLASFITYRVALALGAG